MKEKREYKAKLQYGIRQLAGDQTGYFGEGYVPYIVDRAQSDDLAKIVADAIDRGVIVGVKQEAAQNIADGVMLQMREEFLAGRSILFGGFFRAALFLRGTVESTSASLGEGNEVVVDLIQGKEYDLDRSDYSWSFAGNDSLPKVDFAMTSPTGIRNKLKTGEPLLVVGRNLGTGAVLADIVYDDATTLSLRVAGGTDFKTSTDNISETAPTGGATLVLHVGEKTASVKVEVV